MLIRYNGDGCFYKAYRKSTYVGGEGQRLSLEFQWSGSEKDATLKKPGVKVVDAIADGGVWFAMDTLYPRSNFRMPDNPVGTPMLVQISDGQYRLAHPGKSDAIPVQSLLLFGDATIDWPTVFADGSSQKKYAAAKVAATEAKAEEEFVCSPNSPAATPERASGFSQNASQMRLFSPPSLSQNSSRSLASVQTPFDNDAEIVSEIADTENKASEEGRENKASKDEPSRRHADTENKRKAAEDVQEVKAVLKQRVRKKKKFTTTNDDGEN